MTVNSPRIAICGAGPGGLMLAVAIGKYGDAHVDLYEANAEITTVGAGIGMWQRTWAAIEELDLVDEMAKEGLVMTKGAVEGKGVKFRRSDQETEGFYFCDDVTNDGFVTMHRASLSKVVKDKLQKNCTVHYSKRIQTYEIHEADTTTNDGARKVTLHFADGTQATADILVGADGVRSPTRTTMFKNLANAHPNKGYENCIDAVWSGTLAYRELLPMDKLRAISPEHPSLTRPTCFAGKNKHIIAFPLLDKGVVNIVGFATVVGGEGTEYKGKWVEDASGEEIRECYAGWEPHVASLLSVSAKPSRWAIHVAPVLPFYASGPVAILGDAAHAMTTHLGQGAAQAIEDAYILGRLLSHCSNDPADIERILSIYSDIRQPVANKVVRDAHKVGAMYEFSAPGLYDGSDRTNQLQKLEELSKEIRKTWAWMAENTIPEQWKAAEARLA